jgi:hypothetical protein
MRNFYPTLETPGANRLRDAHAALDAAVRAACGMKDTEDSLAFLFRLDLKLVSNETSGKSITPPGLPASAPNPADFVTADCTLNGCARNYLRFDPACW